MKRTIISWYFVSFQWRCCWKKVPENRCHSTAQNPRPLFATFFCCKISQLLPPPLSPPPLLPAELKSIILVLPWARVRYLCGMVGKRKRGREGEYILRWKSFASSAPRWTQLCRRAHLLIFLYVLLENFNCFVQKRADQNCRKNQLKKSPAFLSLTPSHHLQSLGNWKESFSLKSITWAVWSWALSDESGPVKNPMFWCLLFPLWRFWIRIFQAVQFVGNSKHRGPSKD